ncbi:MAG: Hsp20/alpha crystallin family protein [Nitrospirae bacterium]|nr:MAG: Hsp20/alpha crystallin family protein [Nitrospirota bacterium]
MTLMTYTPFDRQIDQLFNETLGLRSKPAAAWAPRCNVYEDEQRFVVEAALPGMDAKEIDIQVEDGILTLAGERKTAHKPDQTYLVKEIGLGPFSRSFTLPTNVDQGKVAASYKQGVLVIELPKREETKPRRITIDAE